MIDWLTCLIHCFDKNDDEMVNKLVHNNIAGVLSIIWIAGINRISERISSHT